jgi:putative transposase
MIYNPKTHRRRSIRLQHYDYSQNGAYFITICVQNRECRFGRVENGKMILNGSGQMIEKWWQKLPSKFSNIQLNAFIVMPNHFHGIIVIDNENNMGTENVGAHPCVRPDSNGQTHGSAPTRNTVDSMVQWFKTMTTNEYIRGVKTKRFPPFKKRIWQRNYHEHIIRNDTSWQMIDDYIIQNPETWKNDIFFVE